MTTRPYKPRDSARSVLLTAVHDRLTGLAVHPRGYTTLRPLTGAADTYEGASNLMPGWPRLAIVRGLIVMYGWGASGVSSPFRDDDIPARPKRWAHGWLTDIAPGPLPGACSGHC